MASADAAGWLDALADRYTRDLTPPEFFKAVRALSARYVESRETLGSRSPLDSAGKRAAFAAFYAPLHFLTMREVVRGLPDAARRLRTIHDLGCGTGAAGAAWALQQEAGGLSIHGVDRHPWVVTEAGWTWRQLGLRGSARVGDLTNAAAALPGDGPARRSASLAGTGVLLAWAVNELKGPERARLLTALQSAAARGATVLVVEPIARGAAPWWPSWVSALAPAGAVANDRKFDDVELPEPLAAWNEAAGFARRTLSARTLVISQ